jgi:hypothetical protein
VLPEGLFGLKEFDRLCIIFACIDGAWVERGLAAGWGGDVDLEVRGENFIWVRKLGLGEGSICIFFLSSSSPSFPPFLHLHQSGGRNGWGGEEEEEDEEEEEEEVHTRYQPVGFPVSPSLL